MAFKMTNAELLLEFLMKIYSSNFALIRKATVLNYPLPSHLIDIIQHKAFYIIIQQVTKTSQKAQRTRLDKKTKRQKVCRCVQWSQLLQCCSLFVGFTLAPDPGVQQKIYSWRCTNTKDINITPEYIWLCSTEF